MMGRLFSLWFSVWLLAGCASSAVITASDRDSVNIRVSYPNEAQVMAEAERGCGFYGRSPVPVGRRCADALCVEQIREFSCRGRADYSGGLTGSWLGISVDDVEDHLYAEPPGTAEVVIRRVFVDGPGERAGLRVGDIVETFNGAAVGSAATLVALKQSVDVGDRVLFGIRRGQDRMNASLVAEAWR
jgi:hypothetical protein